MKIDLQGRWHIRLYRGEDLIEERAGRNIITTDGKSFLAAFLYSAAVSGGTWPMRYIAIGTGTGAEAAADAALGTEAARAATGTVCNIAGGIYRVIATFASGEGTGAITEYGLFDTSSSSAGTMFSRDLESEINKGANDTLTVITDVTVA